MEKPVRLAIFVTGGGTNCENIIRYFEGKPEVEIPIVVSSRSDAYALVRAEKLGVPTTVITRQQLLDEPRRVIQAVRGCDYIILAGFLPKIPTYLIDQFPNRIINIHPALIPSFCGTGYYGLGVHEAVLSRGVKVTGATVHFVDGGTDTGPIILQKAVEVQEGDTPEVLQRRVMEQAEWVILPKAIDLIANGRVEVRDGLAHILPEAK